MTGYIAIGLVVAIVGVVLVRMYAARRLAATGALWAIWLRFGTSMFVGSFMTLEGLSLFGRSPVLGTFLAAFGLAFAYLGLRLVQAISRAVGEATTPATRADAVFSPVANYVLGYVGLFTVGLIVLGILALTGLLR